MDARYLSRLEGKESFSRNDLFLAIRSEGMEIGDAMFKVTIQKLLKEGSIARVGRNAYCVSRNRLKNYRHEYGQLACEVADAVMQKFPCLTFSITELVQLNAFVNHQIAQNVVFLSAEQETLDFVFDHFKNVYPGRVLFEPTIDMYHRYWAEDMIVVEKLVSEAPSGTSAKWHARIEKILVDLLTDPVLSSSIAESEYATIYEDAFAGYAVDESCLFRYAGRRGAEKKVLRFIRENTNVKLRKERYGA